MNWRDILVGLEAMAAGGVALTGSTGEDYTISLVNAIVLETADPGEVEDYVLYLRDHPDESDRIRHAARRTARFYTWEAAVRNLLGKLDHQARLQGILEEMPHRVGHQPPQRCNKILLRLSRADFRRREWNAHQACPRPKRQTWLISE
jgi:Glycosyl transferases group 1